MTDPQSFRRPRKVKVTRIVVEHRGRILEGDEAKVELTEASRAFLERHANGTGILTKPTGRAEPDDQSTIGRATKAIEARLVKAFATIARQPIPVNSTKPRQSNRCGLDYFHDQVDSLARFIDAAAGRWDSVDTSRPSSPSPQAIDDANAAIEWLLLVDNEAERRLLVVGATSKRGNVDRRIPWDRLRVSLPQWSDRGVRTMQRAYCRALGEILEKLTLKGLER
jgi:hypothetical protein